MPKRKRFSGLLELWAMRGLMEYVVSFLLFEKPEKNINLFGTFYQLCRTSQSWCQGFFATKLTPMIARQSDMYFWKYYLPKCQQLIFSADTDLVF